MKIAEYNQMMAYLTRPEPLPQPKPEELLKIQEQNRINRLQNLMKDLDPVLMDESKEFIERENFKYGTFGNIKYQEEKRLPYRASFELKPGESFELDGRTFTSTGLSPDGRPRRVGKLFATEKQAQAFLNKVEKKLLDGKTILTAKELTKKFREYKKKYPDRLLDQEFVDLINKKHVDTYRSSFNIDQIRQEISRISGGKLKGAGVAFEKLPKSKQNELINRFPEIYKKGYDFNTHRLGVPVSQAGNLYNEIYNAALDVSKRWPSGGDNNKNKIWHAAYRSVVTGENLDKPKYKLFDIKKNRTLTPSEIEKTNWAKKFKEAVFLDTETGKKFSYDGKIKGTTSLENYINKFSVPGNSDSNRFNNAINKYKITQKIRAIKITTPDGKRMTLGGYLDDLTRPSWMKKGTPFGFLNNHHVFDLTKNFWDTEPVLYKDNRNLNYFERPARDALIKAADLPEKEQAKILKPFVEKFKKLGPIEMKEGKLTLGNYNFNKVITGALEETDLSPSVVNQIKKQIALISPDPRCQGKFAEGSPPNLDFCFKSGQKAINTGNIPEGAAKRNFAKFANKAMEIGKQSGRGLRTITKFGIIPEAIIIGADTLIRTGMGDTLNEAFLRASDIYRTDDAYEQADASEINRRMNSNDGELILNLRKFNAEKAQLDSLKQQKAADLALAGDKFAETNIGMTKDEIEQFYAPKIQEQENNLFNASISDAEERAGLKAETEFADKKGVAYKQSPVGKFLDYLGERPGFKQAVDLFDTEARGEPDVSAQVLENYLSGKIPQEEEKELRDIIDTGGARGVLDAMKKIESLQQVPEGAIREPNVFDEERKTLMELAKTDSALAERLFGPSMTFAGDPIQQTNLQDEMNLDRGIYALGGRIGFADGPDNPSRRMFLKLMGGIASLPIVGKFLKPAAPVVQKLANTTTVMPDWFPDFVDRFIGRSIGKKIDADIMEYKNTELPGVTLTKGDDGQIVVEGKNAYGEPYEIVYRPPGYELVDEKTGKAVQTPGEFIASDTQYRRTGPEMDDYDVDGVVVDDIDDILGGNATELEGYAKGTGESKYTKGQKQIDMADAEGTRADVDEGPDIDLSDYED